LTDTLGDGDSATALTRRTQTRHRRPRQGQDRAGPTDRNMDSWAIAMPGAAWEDHDEQSVWEEIDA
jgi:hypothetical protein